MYTIKNGIIKLANQTYTSIKNDYCIMMHLGTNFRQCEEDKAIDQVGFTLTRLDSIEALDQSKTIDVMGIILEVGPSRNLNLKGGDQKKRRTLTICDESRTSIVVTLWGDFLCDRTDL